MMFHQYIHSKYKDIKGVLEINSGIAGPTAGIFAITHGNEPVGLHVFDSIRSIISKTIVSGRVLLIAVNIKAFLFYATQSDPDKGRMINHNMNRISNTIPEQDSYEFQRLEELQPVLQEIDVALDLHSTSSGENVMGIADTTLVKNVQEFMAVDMILSDTLMERGALISCLLREGKHAYGLECGQHSDTESIRQGVQNGINFLKYYGILSGSFKKQPRKTIYTFSEEIVPCTRNFTFTKHFAPFEKIAPKKIYANDGDISYKNTHASTRYIGLLGKTVTPGDGIGFLFEKLL